MHLASNLLPHYLARYSLGLNVKLYTLYSFTAVFVKIIYTPGVIVNFVYRVINWEAFLFNYSFLAYALSLSDAKRLSQHGIMRTVVDVVSYSYLQVSLYGSSQSESTWRCSVFIV